MSALQHRPSTIERLTSKLGDQLLSLHERQAFGVFTWIGERMGIKSSHVRISFIYLSFITFGSPIFLYLVAAFVLRHKEYFKPVKRVGTIWELSD